MEIIYGNLRSKLVTDNPELLSVLREKYAFYVKGYNYVPSYRKRQWDGKKRYFGTKGEFKTGILHRILDDLAKVGCTDVKITGGPVIDENVSIVPVKSFEYRDYQIDAIKTALIKKRLVVESPTGSGKTLIMAGIVKSLQKLYDGVTAVILFKEIGILTQTYEFFKSCGIKDLGINSGQGFINGEIMLSTVQSIENILDSHLGSCQLLMADEVHQFCKGETTIAAIESFQNATYRFGFTGTPPTDKGDIHGRLTLEGAFGPVYTTRSTDDLIKDGKLAKPIIQIVEYSPTDVVEGLSYQEQYQDHIVNSQKRNSIICDIVSRINSKDEQTKTLILVKDLKHLELLSGMIPGAFTVEGKDNLSDRYDSIQKFVNSKNPSVIIGTNVMQTGISINEITHMINARGLEGEIPTIQGLGRGIRKADNKYVLYFFDFYDKVPYLEKHSKARIKHYKNFGFEINYARA